jgi:hypothetical protein
VVIWKENSADQFDYLLPILTAVGPIDIRTEIEGGELRYEQEQKEEELLHGNLNDMGEIWVKGVTLSRASLRLGQSGDRPSLCAVFFRR